MTGKREKPAKVVPLTSRKCPTCGKSVAAEFRPFCSKRCADVDLGRWLNEDYRIPTDEAPTDAFADEAGGGPNDGPDDGEAA